MIKKICPVCGREFTTNYPQKIYCSKACAEIGSKRIKKHYRETHKEQAKEYYRKNKDKINAQRRFNRALNYEVKVCPTCGKTFTQEHGSQKYCSKECRLKNQGRNYYPNKRPSRYPCWRYSNFNHIPDELCFNCYSKRCRYG